MHVYIMTEPDHQWELVVEKPICCQGSVAVQHSTVMVQHSTAALSTGVLYRVGESASYYELTSLDNQGTISLLPIGGQQGRGKGYIPKNSPSSTPQDTTRWDTTKCKYMYPQTNVQTIMKPDTQC